MPETQQYEKGKLYLFLQDLFHKNAKRFPQSCMSIFPKVANYFFPLLKHRNRICVPVGV